VTGGDEVWWKKGEVAELGGGFASNEGLGLAAWQGRWQNWVEVLPQMRVWVWLPGRGGLGHALGILRVV
jgi:hypothetical protein